MQYLNKAPYTAADTTPESGTAIVVVVLVMISVLVVHVEWHTKDRLYRVHHSLVPKRFPPRHGGGDWVDPSILHRGSVWRASQTDSNANPLRTGVGGVAFVVVVVVEHHQDCSKY